MKDIDDNENYYVGQVKGNQPKLFKAIQQTMARQVPLDLYEEQEKLHGRHSFWSVSVYNARQNDMGKIWAGLARFIHVHKRTIKDGKIIEADRLYISNHYESDAQFFHSGIRGHWEIENNLHWVKDVYHNEDGNQVRKGSGPINYSVFSSIAINIHRKNGQQSIKNGQITNSSNVKELFETWIEAA